MRVKICGLTRRADLELALALGATDVGCVLTAESPRAVTATQAGELLGGAERGVLVFRDASPDEVRAAAELSGIGVVQLHRFHEGDAAALEEDGLEVRRAYDVTGGSLPAVPPDTARPVVLDVGGGGSGRSFDWSLLTTGAPADAFVAGGITPENLPALLAHAPWGIDVSSGIESAPGAKDEARLRALFAILRADAEVSS